MGLGRSDSGDADRFIVRIRQTAAGTSDGGMGVYRATTRELNRTVVP